MQAHTRVSSPSAGRGLRWAQRVHVVGLAGSGLRGMVSLLCERGAKVSGSELLESPVLDKLRLRGVDCRVGHSSGNLRQGTNLVLISAAVKPNNPEVTAAQDRSIPVWKYSECLGHLMAEKNGVAIAGTHGKTTTTAMVTHILKQAGCDPAYLIGGDHPVLGSSYWGAGPHFVAEACEFDRSFLQLRPRVALVTNIEEDHLDYFHSLKDIQKAFADFVSLLPEDGYLTLNRDDPNSAMLSEFCRSRVGTFSLRPGAADFWAEDLQPFGGETRFLLVRGASATGTVKVRGADESVPVCLPVPGEHNVRNALAAAAVCHHCGVALEDIAAALGSFRSVRRRFEVLLRGNVTVVDDYAHHPTEIHSVVKSARETFPGRRLTAVFQAHQHSRLKRFLPQFTSALGGFDRVVVTDVYRSRDTDEDARRVRATTLARRLRKVGVDVTYAPRLDDVLAHLEERLGAAGRGDGEDSEASRVLRQAPVEGDDVVLFLGAGSVTDAAASYALRLAGGERQAARPVALSVSSPSRRVADDVPRLTVAAAGAQVVA